MLALLFRFLTVAVLAACCASAQASTEEGLVLLESRRFQAAYAVFLPEAEKGDARAAFEAGRLLLAGRGVVKDEASGA